MGMVNRLIPESSDNAGAALAAAMKLAEECTENAPMAVRMSRDVVAAAAAMDDDAMLELTNAKFKNVVATEDFLEGPKAFIEKRPPVWTGKPRTPSHAKL